MNCLLLLFLLFLLVHGKGDELGEFWVLDFVLGFEEGFVDGETSEGCGLAFCHHHCDLELGDVVSRLLGDDWVRDQELVVEALLETESGNIGILEAVQTEAEGGISAEDIVEELSTLLDFEVVGSVEGSLVDIGPDFSLNKMYEVPLWSCRLHC